MIERIPEPPVESEPLVPILLSRMRLEDIEHVSRLERRCYALPWSSSAYVTEVGNPSAYYIVAKLSDATLVGYAGMWVIMDEAHLTTVAVDPTVRGKRIGERMLVDMLDYGIRHGAKRATLEVREHNVPAHQLYLKYGFRDVAIRRNYYSDNGENAIIMWADYLTEPDNLAEFEERKAWLFPEIVAPADEDSWERPDEGRRWRL
jgi:ribosomal-protein-alanine N-acetyltransferase